MEDVYEDIELEKAIANKRHKELLTAFRQLAEVFAKADENKDAAIIRYSKDLSLLFGKIEVVLSKPQKDLPTPNVTVVNSNEELATAITLLNKGQQKIIELLSLKPKRLVPTISYGRITSVDIEWQDLSKQKTIGQ